VIDRLSSIMICFGLFFSGFHSFRVVPSFNFFLSDLLLVLGFVVLGLKRNGPARMEIPKFLITPVWILSTMLFTLGFAISAIVNGNPEKFFGVTFQYAFSYLFLFLVLFNAMLHGFKKPLKAYLGGVAAVCALGIAVKIFGLNLPGIVISTKGRMSSTLTNPNALARFIALSFPLLLYAWNKKVFTQPYIIAITTCSLIGLMNTGSFGGIANFSIGAMSFYLLLPGIKRKIKMLIISLSIGVVIVALFGVPAILEERVLPVILAGNYSDAGSANMRAALNVEALEIIGRTPLIGVGPQEYASNSAYGLNVHNTWLIIWAEGGLLSICGWALILAIVFRYLYLGWRSPTSKIEGATGLSVLNAFIFSSFTGTHAYNRYLVLPLVISLILVYYAQGMSRTGR